MKTARLKELVREVSALPPFPSAGPERWAEVEGATAAVLDALPALSHRQGGQDALFDYGEALFAGGDECGAEEVWEALVPEAFASGRLDLAAYCAARLARCASGFGEVRMGLDWCRQGQRWAKSLPPDHPAHLALMLQRGLIRQGRRDWDGARRILAEAARQNPAVDLTLRWERGTPADLRGSLYNGLARLALDWTRETRGPKAGLHVEEARGWIAEGLALPASAQIWTQAIALAAEASLCEGDPREARRRLAEWRATPPQPGVPKARFDAVFLHLGALAALSEHDLSEARKLAGQAFRAVPAAGDPPLEKVIVHDLVRVFISDHEQRYSGHRESTVLPTLDAAGSWILELVDFSEARDGYLPDHHGQLVRTACLALCPRGKGRHRAGVPEDLGVDYLLGAASLHDIGKLELAWPLLNRVRPMDATAQRRLRAHVPKGTRLLESLGFPMAARIVEEHHERADGKGYPFGTQIQTFDGGLLALAEVLVARSQRSRIAPPMETLAETAHWCLHGGRRRFQPQALLALHHAMQSGALDLLGSALGTTRDAAR